MTPDQLKDALGYGAGAVLAIECRTNKMRVSRVINGTCRDATIESAIRAYWLAKAVARQLRTASTLTGTDHAPR